MTQTSPKNKQITAPQYNLFKGQKTHDETQLLNIKFIYATAGPLLFSPQFGNPSLKFKVLTGAVLPPTKPCEDLHAYKISINFT